MTFRVEKPGLWTTVQDLGRTGWQRYGVSVGGPMDAWSYRIANALAGNREGAAVLEMTLSGGVFEAVDDRVIVACGADMAPRIDNEPMPMWRPVFVKSGTMIRFASAASGRFTYLAVAGGFSMPEVLGSRSTASRSPFPGLAGRPLSGGDILPVGESAVPYRRLLMDEEEGAPFVASKWFLGDEWRPPIEGLGRIRMLRAIRGKEWERFDAETRAGIERGDWTCVVRPESDRMGYRLDAVAPVTVDSIDMLSEAVTFGTVQVPPDGRPIALMADRQTTGGYPRLLQIVAADLPSLAQARPGEQIRIQLVELEDSVALFTENERRLQWLQHRLAWGD